MLLVMALMVIVGHAGVWKARAHTNARQAVWRTFYYRSGHDDPNPRGWTSRYAEMGQRDSHPPLLEEDPYPQGQMPFSLVRGQPYADPNTGRSIPVRPDEFEMLQGLQEGFADYEGPWPFLQSMPPGRYQMQRPHPVLDDRWQFTQQGLGSNRQRRVLWLYPVDLRPQIPDLVNRYVQAAIAVIRNPLRPDLLPLDMHPDGERRRDYHRQRFTLDGEYGGAPGLESKVHPRLKPFVCSFDPEVLRAEVVNQMIEEIRGTDERPRDWRTNWGRPGVMTDDYLELYRPRLRYLEQLVQQNPNLAGQYAAEIALLERYIEELEEFRDEVLTP